MTWSSADPRVGAVWFPARPALLPQVGGGDVWALEELAAADAQAGEPPLAPAAAFELEEARREAEVAAERERVITEAYSEGYADGEAAGRAAEAARLRPLIAATEAALDQLREGESRWTGNAEENLCALAVAIARHVIGRELTHDAATLTELVRRALTEFPLDQAVSIRLHPADLATLATLRPAAEGAASGTSAVAPNRDARWVADGSMPPGGCVVEGRERIVDGRVDTALERVYRRLTNTHA